MFTQQADHVFLHIGLGLNAIEEVGSIERGCKRCRIVDIQILENIRHDFGGGGRRQSHDGPALYRLNSLTQLTVFRPEIMPPFRDAVGFVDGIKGNR